MTEHALYLDAAGHPSDQPAVVVAGFVAAETQWLAFESEWKSALNRHRLGSIFHMTDFEAKYKNDPRHYEILRDLIDTIYRHVRAAIAGVVEMDDYCRVNEKYPLEEAIGKPYSIAARGVHRNLGLWKKAAHCNDPVLIFVEKGTEHEGDMKECFVRDKLPEPIPVDKSLPPVQAADLYAWEMAYFLKTGILRPSAKLIRASFPLGIKRVDGKYTRRRMMESLDEMGIPQRKGLPKDCVFTFNSAPKKKRTRTIK